MALLKKEIHKKQRQTKFLYRIFSYCFTHILNTYNISTYIYFLFCSFMTHLNNCESQKEILMQTFFFHFSRFLIMSSTDSEIQRDELDVLTSILDETAFEINEKTTTTETTHGTLVIEVTLPDEFYIAYHSSIIIIIYLFFFILIYSIDQCRRIQYLPPIFLRFILPNNYPTISPPSFQLECIWMIDEQVKIVLSK